MSSGLLTHIGYQNTKSARTKDHPLFVLGESSEWLSVTLEKVPIGEMEVSGNSKAQSLKRPPVANLNAKVPDVVNPHGVVMRGESWETVWPCRVKAGPFIL
jgi:hypothetical protein